MYGGDEINAVVCDIGSHSVKAGFAGEDQPKSVFPSMVGVGPLSGDDPTPEDGVGSDQKRPLWTPFRKGNSLYYVGNTAVHHPREKVEVKPIHDETTGLIQDWDAIESVMSHLYRGGTLAKDTSTLPLMLSESASQTDEDRERLVSLLFETFNVPAIFLAKDAVLATFAYARSSGFVVDAGYHQTTLSAVLDGFLLKGSVSRLPLAGRMLDKAIRGTLDQQGVKIRPMFEITRLLDEKGVLKIGAKKGPTPTESFTEFQRNRIVGDLKEALFTRMSDIAMRVEDIKHLPEIKYELPDGSEIALSGERLAIPELLLNPDLATALPGCGTPRMWGSGETCVGLSMAVKNAIAKVDVDLVKDLYGNIVLAGGTSLITGFKERLEAGVGELAPVTAGGSMKVRVLVPTQSTERRFAQWIGGSILASLGTFQQMWMSRQEYQEHGAALIHKRAP